MAKTRSLLTGDMIDLPEEEVETGMTEEQAMAIAARAEARVVEADRQVAEAQRICMVADRARLSAESELVTMTARVQAMKDLLVIAERNVFSEKSSKELALSQVSSLEAQVRMLSLEVDMSTSLRQAIEEMKGHMNSNTMDLKSNIMSTPHDDAVPIFELSFQRDSNGRIKTPVIAKPRVQ